VVNTSIKHGHDHLPLRARRDAANGITEHRFPERDPAGLGVLAGQCRSLHWPAIIAGYLSKKYISHARREWFNNVYKEKIGSPSCAARHPGRLFANERDVLVKNPLYLLYISGPC